MGAEFLRHVVGVALGLMLAVVVISIVARVLDYLRWRFL